MGMGMGAVSFADEFASCSARRFVGFSWIIRCQISWIRIFMVKPLEGGCFSVVAQKREEKSEVERQKKENEDIRI